MFIYSTTQEQWSCPTLQAADITVNSRLLGAMEEKSLYCPHMALSTRSLGSQATHNLAYPRSTLARFFWMASSLVIVHYVLHNHMELCVTYGMEVFQGLSTSIPRSCLIHTI